MKLWPTRTHLVGLSSWKQSHGFTQRLVIREVKLSDRKWVFKGFHQKTKHFSDSGYLHFEVIIRMIIMIILLIIMFFIGLFCNFTVIIWYAHSMYLFNTEYFESLNSCFYVLVSRKYKLFNFFIFIWHLICKRPKCVNLTLNNNLCSIFI